MQAQDGREQGLVAARALHNGHAHHNCEHRGYDGLGEYAPQPAALHQAHERDDKELGYLHSHSALQRYAQLHYDAIARVCTL